MKKPKIYKYWVYLEINGMPYVKKLIKAECADFAFSQIFELYESIFEREEGIKCYIERAKTQIQSL